MLPRVCPVVSDQISTLEKLPIETRLFINGEFVPAKSGRTFDVVNPVTERVSATVHEADASDVDDAVVAAKAAFPAWSELGVSDRARYLLNLADAVERHFAEMAYLDSISMGKPVDSDFGTLLAINGLRHIAGRAYEIQGETSLNTPGFLNLTFRQPYGVCGAITPWNVPLLMVTQKLGPALLTGNTIVIKTSEKAPLSALVLAKCCQEIDLPKGVVNILSGFGQPCGDAIARHMDIRKLSFTGSTATGKAIKRAAAESNLKNVTLELGGKSPLIIFEDADIQKAAQAAAFSILVNSGQACVASSRVYVQSSIASEFTSAVKTAMAAMGTSGDPLVAGTARGPQADKLQFDRVVGFLEEAKSEGAEIVMGGGHEEKQGYYIQPTIFKNVPETSRVFREEIFGPVMCLGTFDDEETVLKSANDSEFGLYASVFTRDISRGIRVAKRFEAGNVGINCSSPTGAVDMPFGGWKQSGEGQENSKHGMEAWTELKSVYIAL